ncbi:hypothetical protein QM480_19920 [Flectobacillus sp. DC10W]|uniref:Anti-sigma factor n=1 Tax=Flectobacillus longus TaxID=2984207 RepID=A0ABT6YT63_9BACT|nr:hypothetical protein [Flectobacillus longus]MDI9866619.1 hypothetical protein [Flectobacillus longus]
MEKHNIDKLFNERLQNYERKPRPEAWDKLQAKLQQNETKIVPLWWKVARAASVVLLLGTAGYFVWETTTTNPEVEGSSVAVVNSHPKAKEDKLAQPNKSMVLEKTGNGENKIEESLAQAKPLLNKIDKQTTHKSSVKKHFDKLIEVTKDTREPVLAQKETPQPLPKVTNNTIILVMEPTPEQTTPKTAETIVLSMVEAPAGPGVERPGWVEEASNRKTTKLGKLWQQLKRAKNGEGVDWNELGVKPQKVLARADAKLENTKETIVESVKEIKNNEK